ncbi:MAG: YdcF family protein [Pseudodesulfovibrio sp.]
MRRIAGLFLQVVGVLSLAVLLAAWGLLAFAGRWMAVDDQPVRSDYILPLAGNGSRWIKAAELYKEGYAPVILESVPAIPPPSQLRELHRQMGFPTLSPGEYHSRLLALMEAADAPMEPFGHGHISTLEEAEALRDHLNGRQVSLLIVTSPYHARRAKMIFGKILPESRITVVSSDEDRFGEDWWKHQTSAQNLILEFAKTLHYLAGGVFRSTDPGAVQAAGSASE